MTRCSSTGSRNLVIIEQFLGRVRICVDFSMEANRRLLPSTPRLFQGLNPLS
jgi:hypothetical protein